MDHLLEHYFRDNQNTTHRADGRPTLGLAMIVKNEADNLPFSLGPLVGHFDEIVVVDTGSSDCTPEIAAGYGVKVAYLRWTNDFSAARNHGLRLMTTDYILWLDADNSLSLADLGKIRDRLDFEPRVLLATEVVVPQGDRLWQKRVFPNHPEALFVGSIHEQLSHPDHWPVWDSGAEIRHWGYSDAAAARSKGHRNLQLLISAPETAAGEFYYLYQTGRTLFNLKYLKEADDYLTRAAYEPLELAETEINPALWSHAMILLSQTKVKLGKYAQAEETLKDLCRTRPDYGPGRAQLGRLLYDAERFDEATSQLTKALALGCGDPGWGADPAAVGFTTACLLAKSLQKCGHQADAWRAWKAATNYCPQHPEPYVAMAETSLAGGDRQQAKKFLDIAIGLAPAHRRALNLSVAMEVSQC
ncbi:MAG: glycosyltransferase [Deltaproteobacteria bacterium]|jgi:tetratricopeptide (TPR) repeat protein|nr:glycosyltransferase [Deltaproteobacteria bacterium]